MGETPETTVLTTPQPGGGTELLSVEDLRVAATMDGREIELLHGVDLTVRQGESLGIVGESGSGKTTLARSLLGLLSPGLQVTSGHLRWKGTPVANDGIRKLRGSSIAMVFQDPFRGLNPSMTVGAQVGAVLKTHHRLVGGACRAAAVELLDRVGIPNAQARSRSYPFELSGGLRQRALIAVALAGRPTLLVADEPTTALDATIQAQILDLLRSMRDEFNLTTILVSHDLGVIAGSADRVVVMYDGAIVEDAPTREIFARPRHPYASALLDAVPRLDHGEPPLSIPGSPPQPSEWSPTACSFAPRCSFASERCQHESPLLRRIDGGVGVAACHHPVQGHRVVVKASKSEATARVEISSPTLLEISHATVVYPPPAGRWPLRSSHMLAAVDDVSLDVRKGEILGIVGESGSGKTTLARAVLGDVELTSGNIELDGIAIGAMGRKRPRAIRRLVQMVFQDPSSSLTAHMTVEDLIAEPLIVHGDRRRVADHRDRVAELLTLCGLRPSMMTHRPGVFSGGEQQRIAIARALAIEPQLLVADEPVSSLDVSVKAQITRMLLHLRDRLGLTLVIISHDIAHLAGVTDSLAVMYQGQVIERGPTAQVVSTPRHAYTQTLIGAVPQPDAPTCMGD